MRLSNVPAGHVRPGSILELMRVPVYGDTTQSQGGPAERTSRKRVVSVSQGAAGNSSNLLLTFKGVTQPGRTALRSFVGVVVQGVLVSVYSTGPRGSRYEVHAISESRAVVKQTTVTESEANTMRVTLTPVLYDEFYALEVDTAGTDADAGKRAFVSAMEKAVRKGRSFVLTLNKIAAKYLFLDSHGALRNSIDIWNDQASYGEASDKARARRAAKQGAELMSKYSAEARTMKESVESRLSAARRMKLREARAISASTRSGRGTLTLGRLRITGGPMKLNEARNIVGTLNERADAGHWKRKIAKWLKDNAVDYDSDVVDVGDEYTLMVSPSSDKRRLELAIDAQIEWTDSGHPDGRDERMIATAPFDYPGYTPHPSKRRVGKVLGDDAKFWEWAFLNRRKMTWGWLKRFGGIVPISVLKFA